MRAVTFLLTDIEGSTAAWELDAKAMAVALARHDELVGTGGHVAGRAADQDTRRGRCHVLGLRSTVGSGRSRMELQDAIIHEQWDLREPMRIRIALHTGEVELRDGDYFGRAVNRAARLRSLAAGGQILCSGATAELVVDSLPDDVVLADLGLRELRNLARPEHVFELRPETAEEGAQPPTSDTPMERPALPLGSDRYRTVRRSWERTRAASVCLADLARRWRVRDPDHRRTGCRQDALGRRVVQAGLSSKAPSWCTAVATRTSVRPISPSRKPCVRWCPASAPVGCADCAASKLCFRLSPGSSTKCPIWPRRRGRPRH